jgi:hypothetical protein
LTDVLRRRLVEHSEKWCDQLEIWSADDSTGREVPILSGAELLSQPNKLYLVQSDASGPDGFGYHWEQFKGFSSLDIEGDVPYYAQQWDEDYFFLQSHQGEFNALLHFLRTTSFKDCMLIWVTDCESAMWSLNQGRCRDTIAMEILLEMLEIADSRKIQLVGLWVPRELNTTADYLSHLAALLNVHHVSGVSRESA